MVSANTLLWPSRSFLDWMEPTPSPLHSWIPSFFLSVFQLLIAHSASPCHAISMPLAFEQATFCSCSPGNATFPIRHHPRHTLPGKLSLSPEAEVTPPAFGCQLPAQYSPAAVTAHSAALCCSLPPPHTVLKSSDRVLLVSVHEPVLKAWWSPGPVCGNTVPWDFKLFVSFSTTEAWL